LKALHGYSENSGGNPVEVYTALRELSEYDPAKFEAANEEYLASIGAGKPEAQADRNGTFSPPGADLEKGL
jgi:hypothetical protein